MAGRIIDATLRFVDRFTRPLGSATNAMQRHSQEFQRAGREIQNAGKGISKAGAGITKSVTVPILGIGIGAVKTAAEFEHAMSKVAAISGASAEDVNKLSEKAKEMGAKTKFSAKESADAFSYMAMAGWKATDMMDGIEGVMYLAGATGEDLALTSDIVTDSLTAFGMEASETNRYVDVLAATANSTNTSVAMMGETFKYAAPLAGALGYSVEDMGVAIGIMANNGVKASSAGTALRGIMSRMADPTDKVQAAMDKIGVSLTDNEGKVKPLSAVMGDLRSGFSELTKAQRVQYAAAIAGKPGMTGLLAIVNATEKDFNGATEAINGSAGAAKKMYDVANDNLIGRLTVLQSTIEGIALKFGGLLLPYIEKGVSKIQALADKINGLDSKTQKQIIKFALMAAAVGPAILMFGKLITGVGKTISFFGKLGGAISRAGGIIGLITSPVGIAIGVIAALAGIAFLVIKNWDKVKEFFGKIGDTFKAAFEKAGVPVEKFKILFNSIKVSIRNIVANVKKDIADLAIKIKEKLAPMEEPINKVKKVFQQAFDTIVKVGVKGFFSLLKTVDKALKGFGKIKTFFMELPSTIKKVFTKMGGDTEKFSKNFDSVKNSLKNIISNLKTLFKTGFTFIGDKIKEAKQVISDNSDKISGVINALKNGIKVSFSIIKGIFTGLIHNVSSVFSGAVKIFDGIIEFITGVFTGNWKKAWEGVKKVFGGIFDTFVALVKTPMNAVIGLINGAIEGINKLGLSIPEWVPLLGGKEFKINISPIPMLARGTNNWAGGPAMIHDRGAEIVDLPSGSRVYPHDKSIQMARQEGKGNIKITIAKLADSIVVREDADIDRIVEAIVKKLEAVSNNMGGGIIGDMA